MIKISGEQMAAFDNDALERFVIKVTASLRENEDDGYDYLDDEELNQLVRLGIRVAQDLGFSWESSVAGFVTMMMDVGPRFFENPTVRQSFESSAERVADEDDRLSWAVRNIPPSIWETASENGWSHVSPNV
jgi:hypothetical protein